MFPNIRAFYLFSDDFIFMHALEMQFTTEVDQLIIFERSVGLAFAQRETGLITYKYWFYTIERYRIYDADAHSLHAYVI